MPKLSTSNKVILLACLYLLISLSICWFKYTHFLYTLTDLGIFTNALRQGWPDLLTSTIQGHQYFGDHFSPYLILIKPLFDLFPSPLTLLIIQCLIFAIAAWPLYLIIRKFLGPNQQLFIIALFLFNPITIGINLNEFHDLTLALPLLLLTWYFFSEKNMRAYAISFLATLIVREDLALTMIAFSFFAFLEKRSLKWKLFPLISIPYFFLALKLVGYFRGADYGFLSYYSWLGATPFEMLKNFFLRFDQVAGRFLDFRVFEFLLASLLLFLCLPIIKPRFLAFAFLPYVILVLGPGKGVTILKFQYAIPMLFALILSAAYGLKSIVRAKSYKKYRPILILCAVTSMIYLNLVYGPYLVLAQKIADRNFKPETHEKNSALFQLKKEESALSSYEYLPLISSKDEYYLSYVFAGNQQFDLRPYQLPQPLGQALINFDDLLAYSLSISKELYNQGSQRVSKVLMPMQLISLDDSVAYFQNTGSKNIPIISAAPVSELPADAKPITGAIGFIGAQAVKDGDYLQSVLSFAVKNQPVSNYQLSVIYYSQDGREVFKRYYSLDYGLLPSSTWPGNSIVTARYRFRIPLTKKPPVRAAFQLVILDGGSKVNNLSSAELFFTNITPIGPVIDLLSFSAE